MMDSYLFFHMSTIFCLAQNSFLQISRHLIALKGFVIKLERFRMLVNSQAKKVLPLKHGSPGLNASSV